jgi:predicted nucleic acid-binding protein
MLVLDASALVDLLLVRPLAGVIERHVAVHAPDLHAPQLLDVEVLSALRRVVSSGEASATRASEAIDDLLELPIDRHAHGPLMPRVWQLRETFMAYDATYLALAETLSERPVALLTADAGFARAIDSASDVQALLVA